MSAKTRKAFESHARASGATSLLPAPGVTFRSARTGPPPPRQESAAELRARADELRAQAVRMLDRADELTAAARAQEGK